MLKGLLEMLGFGPKADFAQLKADGAVIIDVRTKAEYSQGHIKGSKNIPLNSLTSQLGKLNKAKPIITCCASGVRSANAKSILKSNGFSEVYNGGGWMSLNRKL